MHTTYFPRVLSKIDLVERLLLWLLPEGLGRLSSRLVSPRLNSSQQCTTTTTANNKMRTFSLALSMDFENVFLETDFESFSSRSSIVYIYIYISTTVLLYPTFSTSHTHAYFRSFLFFYCPFPPPTSYLTFTLLHSLTHSLTLFVCNNSFWNRT